MESDISHDDYMSRRQLHPDDLFNFNKIFFFFLGNWYWFLLGCIIAIIGTWGFLKYNMPVYNTGATLLIEEKKANSSLGTERIMEGFGLNPGLQNVENQLIILSSYSLIEQTLSELPFELEYYYKDKINKISCYQKSPIKIVSDSLDHLPYGIEFLIAFLDENRFHLAGSNEDFEIDIESELGQIIKGPNYSFYVDKTSFWSQETNENVFYFKYHSPDQLVAAYRQRIKVEPASLESTIIKLNIKGKYPQMDRDFLNKLLEVFLRNNLDKKNQEAIRTIAFIDEQLIGIADSLVLTEDRLQEFRSRNRVMNISEQATRILEQAVNLEDDRAMLIIEANYYRYLKKYLQNSYESEHVIAPATLGISDPMLVRLVQQLAELQSEYFSIDHKELNPMRANLIIQINNTRTALLETLESIIRSNELATNENASRLKELNQQAASLPVTERELLGIERQFKLNDALYTFLLQKQAEAQIRKASNVEDNEIIDMARTGDNPVSPKPLIVFLIAVLLGGGVPALIILIYDSMNHKIKSEDDIKMISSLPIVGHIPHSTHPTQLVALENTQADVTEAFRSLRTRMQFYSKEVHNPVILITSSMPNEGKTFTSINLAGVYSLAGKRTILVGADLRRPKIYKDLKLHNDVGVSTFLIGKNKIEDIIQRTDFNFLDFIAAGPVPPNPAELLNLDVIENLIMSLKKSYDTIIIDSAPIGTVSDSYSLANLADITILLIRHNESRRKVVDDTLREIKGNNLSNVRILVNDLTKARGYNGYSYRYGIYSKYGYLNKK